MKYMVVVVIISLIIRKTVVGGHNKMILREGNTS